MYNKEWYENNKERILSQQKHTMRELKSKGKNEEDNIT